MRYELNFEAEPFNAYGYFDSEMEVRRARIQVDDYSRHHIFNERIPERFPDVADQEKIEAMINQLLGMTEPSSGYYDWYVQLEGLNSGGGIARIMGRGHMLRTVLTSDMAVTGTRYRLKRLQGGARILAPHE